MDLMHQCNLLNYFGKSEKVDDIENYPILLKKGELSFIKRTVR
mgnify:CR=1 FL=1